jgi:hypothetical protein
VQGRCPRLVLQLDLSAYGLLQVGSRSREENNARRARVQRLKIGGAIHLYGSPRQLGRSTLRRLQFESKSVSRFPK